MNSFQGMIIPSFQIVLMVLFLGFSSGMTQPANQSKISPQSGLTNLPPAQVNSTNSLGSWIWDKETREKQVCHFWKSFEIPRSQPVVRAELFITADNGYTVFLDGREVGRGSDWKWLSAYDLTLLMTPGSHVLAVEAFNDGDKAGLILGLRAEMADERVIKIVSDTSWRVAPGSERRWEKKAHAPAAWPRATTVGALGNLPWWHLPVGVTKVPPLLPFPNHFWQTAWFQITLISISLLAVLICLRLMAKIAVQSKAQALLQLERSRIARDIHDDLGARLTELVLLGEIAQNEFGSDTGKRAPVEQICERARSILGAIDEIVWVVNSRRDTLKDFVTYVCKYAQLFLRSSSIRCRLDVDSDLPGMTFDLPIRRSLLLAVKEALNNAAKHSEATEVFLRIHRQAQTLGVVVEDNGKGFKSDEIKEDRNGLTNMAQRMKDLGGEYRIISQPGNGCRVEFKIPLIHKPLRSRWTLDSWKSDSVKREEQPAKPAVLRDLPKS